MSVRLATTSTRDEHRLQPFDDSPNLGYVLLRPPDADAALEAVTGVLVTHEHPDHLDVPACRWIEARGLPVWASGQDAANLKTAKFAGT
jgi:L-ascorbate metabolism protein UlaG (beta-lactamase superfamily)